KFLKSKDTLSSNLFSSINRVTCALSKNKLVNALASVIVVSLSISTKALDCFCVQEATPNRRQTNAIAQFFIPTKVYRSGFQFTLNSPAHNRLRPHVSARNVYG